MKKITILFICFLLVFTSYAYAETISIEKQDTASSHILIKSTSFRDPIEDIVIVSDINPLFSLLGSYASCWYTITDSGLKPYLVSHDGLLSPRQEFFIDTFFQTTDGSLLVLGEPIKTGYTHTEFLGSPADVALELADHIYNMASSVLIISSETEEYQLSLIAAPLASYLDIPILIYDDNAPDIVDVCSILNVSNAFVLSDIEIDLPGITIIRLETIDEIQDMILGVIKDKFGRIDYITLANPADVIPPTVIESTNTIISDHISNVKITLLSREFDIRGEDTKQLTITIPDGINRVQMFGNISNFCQDKKGPIVPLIFLMLYDSFGNIVGYSSSLAYDFGSAYLETLTCNASGNYTLEVRMYNGILGGFFSRRGISVVDSDFDIDLTISTLEIPHLPDIPKLSQTAAYLTAAHGGILLADSTFELTDESYSVAAQGHSSGPWYTEELHQFNNDKVRFIVEHINETLDMIDAFDMLDDYISGPAWLGILAGNNMIPQYYYSPSQPGLPEKGLPSDNLYSLNETLSVGRIISWDVQDVSLLIARTFFYEDICGSPTAEDDWHNRFSFIFGEGFGETGGIFHQIPYSREIREYGFDSEVFGDLRNGRAYAELFNVYTGSNYIEYLGHGDWFWFAPSYYGFDMYSKAIDVAHAKDWIYEKPSIFFTSACLMGRIDGVPTQNSIGLTMMHAGCNAFIGATRTTGQEAGLTPFENHLIVDDFSLGEALRGEKKIDKEPPTYYVRTLFGDPAFNPFEPNNGFSSQGRPVLLS